MSVIISENLSHAHSVGEAPRAPRPFSGRHIAALDGLRGLAILGVLLFKASEGFDQPDSWIAAAIARGFGAGWIGVDLFFVLSGFLITGILLDTRSNSHFFRNFYARRTLRIFPLYYGVLFLTFVVAPRSWRDDSPGIQRIVASQGWLWAYLTNIAFVVKRAVFFDSGWIRFNHFWSLAIEEQFYLFWPFLVFSLSRARLKAVCWTLIVLALALRLSLYAAHQRPGAMFYPTPCRMDCLAVGALIAVGIRRPRGLDYLLPLARRGVLLSGAALVAIFVWRGVLDVNDITTLTFGFTIVAAFGACLLILCLDPSPGNWWRRFLETPALRGFGKISYGMYVLHMLVLWILDRELSMPRVAAYTHSESLGMLAYAALVLASVSTVAFVSWHLFEKQFLRLKRYFEFAPPLPTRSGIRPATG